MTQQMEMPKPPDGTRQNPAMVSAARDMGIRKGGGMDTGRPVISYAELKEAQHGGKGDGLRRFAIVMRMPDSRTGEPGAGPAVAMPAEKAQKWFGQGYRFCVGGPPPAGSAENYDTTLVDERPAPVDADRQWVPSMVSDGMAKGEPIPIEMAPPGYVGPMFSLKELREAKMVDLADVDQLMNVSVQVAGVPASVTAVGEADEPWQLVGEIGESRSDLRDDGMGVVGTVMPLPNLEHLNAAGLRDVAERYGVELRDGRAISMMKEDLEAHFGIAEVIEDEPEDELEER